MGESYVHIKLEEKDLMILPVNWVLNTGNLDRNKVAPAYSFDPNTNSFETLKYIWTLEKALISLYCTDLLQGDFSRLDDYIKNS